MDVPLAHSKPGSLQEYYQRWTEAVNTSSAHQGETPPGYAFKMVSGGVGVDSKCSSVLRGTGNP